jgi:hypothetical protein
MSSTFVSGRVMTSEVSPEVFAQWMRDATGAPRLLGPLSDADRPARLAPLAPAERLALDTQLTAKDPDRIRWHLSVVPAARVPTVVAWYGRPEDPAPQVLSRVWDPDGRPALWMGGTREAVVRAAQTALLDRGIPAQVSPLPPALAKQLAVRSAPERSTAPAL